MELKIERNGLRICLSPTNIGNNSSRNLEEAFIEDVLGLKEDGDFVLLTRKDYGKYRFGHLETIKPRANISSIEYDDGSADVFVDIPDEDLGILKEEAKKQNISLNQLCVNVLKEQLNKELKNEV